MARISLDNGHSYMTADDAVPVITDLNMWDVVTHYMDDDTREQVHRELAPCTEIAFLRRYLELAPCDLVIG